MFFKCIKEIFRQIPGKTHVLILTFAIHTAIVFNTSLSWKNHTATLYGAQMSVIDAVLFNCQKRFFTFLLPLLSLMSMIFIPEERYPAILRRGGRARIWAIFEIKSALICLGFSAVHILMSILSALWLGIKIPINWESERSVYFSANGFTCDAFGFRGLLALSAADIFLISLMFMLIFDVIRSAISSAAGVMAVVALGFNEAWFAPVFTRFSGLYHIRLVDGFNALLCLGTPIPICLLLTLAGRVIYLKKEFYRHQ